MRQVAILSLLFRTRERKIVNMPLREEDMAKQSRNILTGSIAGTALRAALLGTVVLPFSGLALAQDADDPIETTTETTTDASDANRTLETVTVTGSRAVIQNTIDIKRNSNEIVDALSAEDIGDLPALSIGEALENITGAASHRENGGATEISIRGLGPFLSSTVFNGRQATNGSGDRSVNFSQFPSELVNKVAIYKTQSADLIEGGVAGQIHIDTLRPLDYGKQRFQAELKANLNPDQLDVEDSKQGALGYRGSISYVDNFDFGDGQKFGFSIGLERQDISQPEQEFRSSSPTGTSLRPCLVDAANIDRRDVSGVDDDEFGRGFTLASSDDDDCEDIAGSSVGFVDFLDNSVDPNGIPFDTNQDGSISPADVVAVNQTGFNTLVADPNNDLGQPFVFVPNERGFRQNDTSDQRTAFFGAAQWQPNDRLDINFDVQYSERIQEEDRHDIAFVNSRRNVRDFDLSDDFLAANPDFPTSTFDSLVFSDTGALTSFVTETNIEARGETFNRTEEYIGGGLSASYDVTDRLTVTGDVSFSETNRTEEQLLIRTQNDDRLLVAWTRDDSIAGNFTIVGDNFDINDHGNFIDRYRARIDNDLDRRNTVMAGRLDVNYETDWGIVKGIDAGVRYASQEYLSLSGARSEFEIRNDRNSTDAGFTILEEDAPGIIADLNESCAVGFQEGNAFLESIRSGDLFTFLDSDGNVTGSSNSFASFDTTCLVEGVVDAFGADVVIPDLEPGSSTIDVTEDTLAFYAQANYETELGSIPVRGKIGVRVVQTDVESVGIRDEFTVDASDPTDLELVATGETTTVVGGTDYTEILPSFSFVADLTDDVIVRGGIFRGLSRADPEDMGFQRDLNTVSQGEDDEPISDVSQLIQSVVADGNPAFEPLTSWNYDLSFEWYPNDDSILAVGAYYKQFTGGFQNVSTTEFFEVDGQQIPGTFVLSQTNNDTSDLFGIELTATHNFSYLPGLLSGFGAKISYNWADSSFEFEDSNLGDRGFIDENGEFILTNEGIIAPGNVPGFSEQTFSGQVYYQIGKFDGSVIYKYRDQYFQPFTSNGTRLRYVNDAGVWEARAAYKVTDNFRLKLEAINLFDEERSDTFYTTDNIGQGSVYGQRIFLGGTLKF